MAAPVSRRPDTQGDPLKVILSRPRQNIGPARTAPANAPGPARQSVPIIPYTEQTAYEHARIWAELEVSGKMIGFYDLIVGATALERGSQVATYNKRHFAQIRGLSVIEPK